MLAFPLTPFADESVNGYLLRLAEENFMDSSAALLHEAGVRLKARYSEAELNAISETHGLDCAGIQQLAGFSQVAGSLSQGRFLRTAAVPVCVECLRASAYIRQAWHHQLFTACPEHQRSLLEACPECSAPLDLKRHSITTCRCGYDLTTADVAPADPASLWVASLLWPASGISLPGLEALPQDVDAFLLFLANLTLAEPHRKNAPIDTDKALAVCQASHQIGNNLLPRFRDFVEAKIEAANQMASSRFMLNLGSWYRELNTEFAGEVYAPLREIAHRLILERANAPINRKMKQLGAELLGLKATLTAAEAARTLKSSADRIVALVKSGELGGTILQGATSEFCLVKRTEVEAHQQAAADFLYGKDLLKLLGISRRMRDRLTETGLLSPVPEMQRPLFARGDYRRSEALALLERLTECCCEIDEPKRSLSFADISGKRFSNAQANDLLKRVFAGDLQPLGRVRGIQGFAAFRFDEETLADVSAQHSTGIEFTITDLTKITPWKHQTIKGWIDAGYLRARVEPGKKYRTFIGLADLIAFLSTYVVAADAADRLGSKSAWLKGTMKRVGALVTGPSGEVESGLLLSVDALVNIVSNRAPTWSRPSKPRARMSQSPELKAVVDQFCQASEVHCA